MVSTDKAPGPQVAMLWFFIVTTLYIPVKYMGFSIDKGPSLTHFVTYVLLVIVGEYVINLHTSNAMCNTPQWASVVTNTITPWFIIFGSLKLLLTIFPGWLAPFSNTIGYMIVKSRGAAKVLSEILHNDGSKEVDPETRRTLARIFTNESLMINEVPGTVPAFIEFWSRISPLMSKKAPPSHNDTEIMEMLKLRPPGGDGTPAVQTLARRLFDFIRMKNLIAEYIWLLLTGALVTSVSYNHIVGSSCKLSAKSMTERHNKFIAQEAEEAKQRERAPTRVYRSIE